MYSLVGCSDCNALWILEGEQETTTCRSCGKRHQVDSLRKFVETEVKEVARERRAEMLADRAGHGEEYRSFQSETLE